MINTQHSKGAAAEWRRARAITLESRIKYDQAWSSHGWVTIATCSEISLESNYMQTLQSPFDGTSSSINQSPVCVCMCVRARARVCVVCVCVCVYTIKSHLHVKLKDPVVHVLVDYGNSRITQHSQKVLAFKLLELDKSALQEKALQVCIIVCEHYHALLNNLNHDAVIVCRCGQSVL